MRALWALAAGVCVLYVALPCLSVPAAICAACAVAFVILL